MIRLLVVLSLILPVYGFSVENDSAKSVVEEIFNKAAQEKVKVDQKFQNSINANVDFEAMAKAVLGKEGKKISAKEFEWFYTTLKEIISRTVYPNAPEFLAGVKISYKNIEQKKNIIIVKSEVQNKADITEVNYSLAKAKDGSWKVIDVSFDDESWVESIKEQVSDTIKKKKWTGLKKQLNERLEKLRQEQK